MVHSTASQRVFDIEELRGLIFDCLEPRITPADATRYVRVARKWYYRFIRSVYECLELEPLGEERRTALLDTLASCPYFAEMVGYVNTNAWLPFHCFRLVLDICVNMTSLSFNVTDHIPLPYRMAEPLSGGASFSITSLHLALLGLEPDGLEALFFRMTSLRSFRLDQASMAAIFKLLQAIPSALQDLYLQSPYDVPEAEPADSADDWGSIFLAVPTLISLHVEGRARGLAAAGFNAPPSLQQLEISSTLLSDYAAPIENFGDPTWFSGLSTMPRFTLISESEIPCRFDIMEDALKKRNGMVWNAKAAADLRSLPRAGWTLYRRLLLWESLEGDSASLETFMDLYGDQFHEGTTQAE